MDKNNEPKTIVVNISTENLVDPSQIGWVDYREDNLVVRAKVVRAKNGWPFLALPTLFKRNVGAIEILRYENTRMWEQKKKKLLEAFKNHVGAARFFPPDSMT